MPSAITRSPNRSRPLAFHELHDETFEEMTCALLAEEPHIVTADLFGTRGQSQYGVDMRGERSDGGIDIVSCKRYKEVKESFLAKWSNEFLKHWDTYWKDKGVRRFVLSVATEINSTKLIEAADVERARFHALSISYEVWGPRHLEKLLRGHPGIVSKYLGAEFVEQVCGVRIDNVATVTPDGAVLSHLVVTQIATLQEALSREVEQRLDVAMDGIRRGDLQNVAEQLSALRNGPHWHNLHPATQARSIRLQASLRLQHGDVTGAEHFAAEADAIALPDEPRLRALIATRRHGASAGLAVLGDPTSRDGVQMKLSLLLEANQRGDAIAFLESSPVLRDANAETERLRAYVELLRGQRDEALAAIQRAERMEPSWPAIRRAGAIVRYALALSPMTTPEWHLGLNPVDLDLVREDDVSRALLTEAQTRFDALAAEVADPETRQQDEAWALACLSNMRDRLMEAEARCRTLLAKHPTHSLVLMWALGRGYDIDRERSIQALRELIEQRQADAQHVLVYAWLLAADNRFADAYRALHDAVDLFDTPRAQPIHAHWLAEFGRGAGQVPAEPLSSKSLSPYRLADLIEQATQTGDWTPVEQHFALLMTAPAPPLHALAAARALAGARRWTAIVPHADALLRFDTAEAVRISVHAARHADQPKRALEIIETHRAAFPGGRLPNDLRAIEVEALNALGDPATALRRASMLAAESTALVDQMVKVDVHLRTGNIRAALPTIRQVIGADVLSSTHALYLAQAVRGEDPELARELWRFAKAKGIPVTNAVAAFFQAFQLGIEHEAKHLFGVMTQLAQQGDGPVRMATVQEVIELSSTWREQSKDLERLYFDGIAPVHLIVERANGNVGKLYQLPPPGTDSPIRAPLMIRHGARPSASGLTAPIADCRLYLDITGLLVAHQLGLLEVLERLPHPLALAPSLPRLLQELEGEAWPHQPTRVAAMRAIVNAIESETIVIADAAAFEGADDAAVDGASTKALRLAQAIDPAIVIVPYHMPQIANEVADRYTTLRAVLEGLHMAGRLDANVYQEALERIGKFGQDTAGKPPPAGATLLFLDDSLALVASACALDLLAQVYHIQIDPIMSAAAYAEQAQADRDEAMAKSLARLRNHVAEGLESGRYILFGTSNERGNATDAEDGATAPSVESVVSSLFDIVRADRTPGAVVWVDDRHLSGYHHNGQGNPLVGVTDVLQGLERGSYLSKDRYYDALCRLRAGGAMFIPVDVEEVRHHLQRAPVVDGAVIETPALATLRRYVALALRLDIHLKVRNSPPELEGRPEEIPFLLNIRRLAEECVIAQWNDNQATDDIRRARSSWIWNALRVDNVVRQDLLGDAPERTLILPAMQICGLLLGGLQISARPGHLTLARRTAFFRWVKDAAVGSRLDHDSAHDSALVERVVQTIIPMLVDVLHQHPGTTSDEHRLVRQLVRNLVEQFPSAIRRRVLADMTFCRAYGVEMIPVVHIGKHTFRTYRFWRAVAKALNYGKAHVRDVVGRRRLIIRALPGKCHTVRLSRAKRVFTDPTFSLLSRSPSDRIAQMRQEIDWFDMPLGAREEAIVRIAHIHDVAARIGALNDIRRRSAAWHYRKLRDRLRVPTGLSFRAFRPPPADDLLHHLRLPLDAVQPFADRLIVAAHALVTDYGPNVALQRLAGLPVKLPDPILRAFGEMPTEEQAAAVAAVCNGARTPLQLLHALFLLRHVAMDRRYVELFNATVTRMLTDWRRSARLFTAVLKWVDDAYESDSVWAERAAPDRLALVWTHADRLADGLLGAGFDVEQVTRDFAANHVTRPMREVLRLDPAYHAAAATPDSVQPASLLFHGLAYVCGIERVDAVFSSTHVAAAVDLLSMHAEGAKLPSPWLFLNREAGNNELSSFLTQRPEAFSSLDASAPAVAGNIDRLVRELETDRLSRTAWPSIWAMGQPTLRTADRERLLAVLHKVDLVDIVSRDPDDIFLCRLVIDCWSRLNDPASHSRMVAQLEGLATYLASRHPGPVPMVISEPPTSLVERDVVQLIEAVALASRSVDRSDAFRRLGETSVRTARAWPAAARLIRHVVNTVALHESSHYANLLWSSLLELRGT